jgi:hypothetical protein
MRVRINWQYEAGSQNVRAFGARFRTHRDLTLRRRTDLLIRLHKAQMKYRAAAAMRCARAALDRRADESTGRRRARTPLQERLQEPTQPSREFRFSPPPTPRQASFRIQRASYPCVVDGRDEPITALRHGFDEARILGRIVQCFAKPVNRLVQRLIEIDEGVVAPQLLAQFFSAHDLAGALQQDGQHAEGLLRQLGRRMFIRCSFAGGRQVLPDREFEGITFPCPGMRPNSPSIATAGGLSTLLISS